MARTVREFALGLERILILQEEGETELARRVEAATRKGWQPYLDGRDPGDRTHVAWLIKPLQAPSTLTTQPLAPHRAAN